MPLNLSFTHIVVVLLVALVVLGPDKLPEAARSASRFIRELRRFSTGLQAEVRDTFGEFTEPFTELVSSVTGGVTSVTSGEQDETGVSSNGSGDGATSTTLAPPGSPSPLAPSLPALGPSTGYVSPGPALPVLASLPELGDGSSTPGTFAPRPDGVG